MNLRILAAASVVTLLFSGSAFAQNPLEGAWEHTSRPGTLAICTSEGVFAVMTLPPGRPKVEKPISELTEQELRGRYAGIGLQYGTYTIAGDRLTRHVVAALDPGREGTQAVYQFRIEGDTLIITSTSDATSKTELRFRSSARLKQSDSCLGAHVYLRAGTHSVRRHRLMLQHPTGGAAALIVLPNDPLDLGHEFDRWDRLQTTGVTSL